MIDPRLNSHVNCFVTLFKSVNVKCLGCVEYFRIRRRGDKSSRIRHIKGVVLNNVIIFNGGNVMVNISWGITGFRLCFCFVLPYHKFTIILK